MAYLFVGLFHFHIHVVSLIIHQIYLLVKFPAQFLVFVEVKQERSEGLDFTHKLDKGNQLIPPLFQLHRVDQLLSNCVIWCLQAVQSELIRTIMQKTAARDR